MNLAQFFEHWGVTENPFRGEEARHDAVFSRMAAAGETGARKPGAFHSEFEKILGELTTPSTAVVFGEKGSGKTAIRLQISDRVSEHNANADAEQRGGKLFVINYDDLNRFLDRFHARTGKSDPMDSFKRIRLVDHMDAILALGVTPLVGSLMGDADADSRLGKLPSRRAIRALPSSLRQDLLALQAVYDMSETAGARTGRLRRGLGLGLPMPMIAWTLVAVMGWVIPAAVVALFIWLDAELNQQWLIFFGVAVLLWGVLVAKRFVWDKGAARAQGRRLVRQLKMLSRVEQSYADSLGQLPAELRRPNLLPMSDSDEQRYAMLDRFRRVLGELGFTGILIVMDRVDEPTLISGDPERMRAVVWPMFNNKFLQQDRIGFKLLLPIELRYALFRESAAFFQEARLDKQNLVERLSWTGAMLYDLCDARLQACRATGAEPIGLLNMFDEDVTRQDLVDALDQMHQPRDAFKFLYRCFNEHCSNVTQEQNAYRVPRLVLESVRKAEADRVQQLYRGIRPA
ncbi:MAG: hypothetical protein AAGG07_04850 [Planctomycetota bacterium]